MEFDQLWAEIYGSVWVGIVTLLFLVTSFVYQRNSFDEMYNWIFVKEWFSKGADFCIPRGDCIPPPPHTHTHRDRERERERETEREKEKEKETERQRDRDGDTDRQTDREKRPWGLGGGREKDGSMPTC